MGCYCVSTKPGLFTSSLPLLSRPLKHSLIYYTGVNVQESVAGGYGAECQAMYTHLYLPAESYLYL